MTPRPCSILKSKGADAPGRGGEAGPPRSKGPESDDTSGSLWWDRPQPVTPLLPADPARAALTRCHHRPPPDRVIKQAGAVAQEADAGEPWVGQLGRGQAPGLIRQEP